MLASRAGYFVAAALVALTLLISFEGAAFGQKALIGTDNILAFPPWNQRAVPVPRGNPLPLGDTLDVRLPRIANTRSRLWDGDIPEWDPTTSGGFELAATTSDGLLNPLTLPYLVAPLTLAPALVKMLEILVGVFGFIRLGRRRKWSMNASVAAGIVFALSGFPTMSTNWTHSLMVPWIPWLFERGEALAERRTWGRFLGFVAVVFVMLAGGFPALLAYALYSLGFFLLFRALLGWREARLKESVQSFIYTQATLVFGVLLAVALLAFQLVGLASSLLSSSLGDRFALDDRPWPLKSVAQLVFANALGDPVDGRYYGTMNAVESIGFIGGGALLLGSIGTVVAFRSGERINSIATAVCALLWTITIYLGGPTLAFAGLLPGIAGSRIGRARVMIAFFVATALADAVSRLVRGEVIGRNGRVVLGAGLVGFGLLAAKVIGTALAEGEGSAVLPSVIVGIFSVAVCTLWVIQSGKRRTFLVVASVGLVLLESSLFARGIFPKSSIEEFYAVTTTHDYLLENQGDTRSAFHELTMYPGTTAFYGINSISGHVFHDETWKEMLQAVDPNAMSRSPTFSFTNLANGETLGSGILDRLSARHAVLPPQAHVFGSSPVLLVTAPERVDPSTLEFGLELDAPLAGFVIDAASAGIDTTSGGIIRAALADANGDVFAEGYRLLVPGTTAIQLALPNDDMIAERLIVEWTATPLATPETEVELTALVADPADNLKVVLSDGAVVYERLSALPLYRTPRRIIVEPDPEMRIELLTGPLDEDVAILSASHPKDESTTEIEILSVDDSDPDDLRLTINSDDGGWLVVSAAMQNGWTASADQVSLGIVAADHAGIAVYVPAGASEVRFQFGDSLARYGFWVTLVTSVLMMLGAGVIFLRKRRLKQAESGSISDRPERLDTSGLTAPPAA